MQDIENNLFQLGSILLNPDGSSPRQHYVEAFKSVIKSNDMGDVAEVKYNMDSDAIEIRCPQNKCTLVQYTKDRVDSNMNTGEMDIVRDVKWALHNPVKGNIFY